MMRTGKQFKSVRAADLSTPTSTPRFITYKPQGTVLTTPTISVGLPGGTMVTDHSCDRMARFRHESSQAYLVAGLSGIFR
jgi:hypothetical protein